MSMVVRATELIGRPIVTLDGSVDIAEVRDVVFDPQESMVAGFALRGRGVLSSPDAGVLPISRVRAIGRDAIMVAHADDVAASDVELSAAQTDRRNVLGDTVVTESGSQVGKVVNLILRVEGGSAEVVGYEIQGSDSGRSLIPVHATLSVSGDTLMVKDEVDRYASADLAGFGAAVDRHRQGDRA